MRTPRPETAARTADAPAPPRHAAGVAAHSLRRRLGIAGLGIALFAGTGAAVAYNDIQGNIDRHDISDLLGERPSSDGDDVAAPIDAKAGEALDILVIGSDVRQGESDVDGAGAAGEVTGMRSDTTMIAHISADRSRVDVVSIPRDTLVDIPSCMLPDGTRTRAQDDVMFNSAFQLGGQSGDVGAAAACTIRTVEELTGVLIDDFVVVDFAGFTNVVQALDGVPMYVDQDIDDTAADLHLEMGCQILRGGDALGFARARKSVGDGSDISRIGRQQDLVAAIAREALSKNLLTDLPALYRFLDAATQTLTTGQDIGRLPVLAGLANSLRQIHPSDIRFATMPFEWAGNRVVPAPQAELMWEALRTDQPIEATLTGTGEEPTQEPTETAGPTAAPTTPAPTTPAPTATPTPATPTPGPATCTRETARDTGA